MGSCAPETQNTTNGHFMTRTPYHTLSESCRFSVFQYNTNLLLYKNVTGSTDIRNGDFAYTEN